jgi:hypothetical protein
VGLLPHLFPMGPDPQNSSHLLSGPAFVYVSTQYQTPPALMPFLINSRATFLPFTRKTTDDAAIFLFYLLSLIWWVFASDCTCVGIFMYSFDTSHFSPFFFIPSVPFSIYNTIGTTWMITIAQDSFCSTSPTPLSTVLTAVMIMLRYL